jgi:5-methylcytosine-specific restriction endonuclease McrA
MNEDSHYERGKEIDVPLVIDYVLGNEKLSWAEKVKRRKLTIDGHSARITSLRFRMFALKGVTCAHCGREGTFFAYEKPSKCPPKTGWHLNLYAVDEDGTEVQMTMDHITPKALGGKDILSNVQPMCEPCNNYKGSRYIG